MLVYIAGGWFSDAQLKAVKELEELADELGYNSFKPRVHNKGNEGCNWDRIFYDNIYHIEQCSIVFASTVDKDMGTIWECGFAYAKGKKIVYYTPGIPKVNLMLSMTGAICPTIDSIKDYLNNGKERDYEIE